ncbi:MAG: sulfatase [Acidobacteriota bacterium]|jgi:arylsulfatase A-like enzyme
MLSRREFISGTTAAAFASQIKSKSISKRPNILYILADNFFWNHMGAYGCKAIATPNFDRIAREGVLFTNAYCNAPSCSPSRAAMLTGQHIWRLEEGGNLWGELPAKFAVYPDLLEASGYWVGYAGKGYAPGSTVASGRKRNPAGPQFNEFGDFLLQRPKGKPFCFWYGGVDSNQLNAPVIRDGVDLQHFEFPSYLPAINETRNDFYQYFQRLRGFDSMIGTLVRELDATGELENTIIVVAADNGIDQPGGYPNLYDAGTREFLAIRWGAKVPGGRTVTDFVTLSDLAPTFLEAAGLPIPAEMTARSLLPILQSTHVGQVDPARNSVVLGRERHAWARRGGLGYPMRAIRTLDYLYIRNYEPERWPAGDPDFNARIQGYYGDVDQTESKWYILAHKDEPEMKVYFDRIFAKRPPEELFDVKADPDQMHNLAANPKYAEVKKRMSEALTATLKSTKDPRESGGIPMWDSYPYYNPIETTVV